MKNRHLLLVFFLPFVTFGIYSLYWLVSTKNDMNRLGEKLPTAWFWLIPIVGPLWWYWKYAEGVEHVTTGRLSSVLTFILLLLLGNIGHTVIQDFFNKIVAPASTPTPITEIAQPMPIISTVPPTTNPAPVITTTSITSPLVPTDPTTPPIINS